MYRYSIQCTARNHTDERKADNSFKLPPTLNVTRQEEFKSPVSGPSSQKSYVKIPTGFGNLIESETVVDVPAPEYGKCRIERGPSEISRDLCFGVLQN